MTGEEARLCNKISNYTSRRTMQGSQSGLSCAQSASSGRAPRLHPEATAVVRLAGLALLCLKRISITSLPRPAATRGRFHAKRKPRRGIARGSHTRRHRHRLDLLSKLCKETPHNLCATARPRC